MKTILNLALKDLNLLRRDKAGLFWIFLFPLVFALFFGSITGGGGGPIRGLTLNVTDEDGSPESQALLGRLQKNEGLKVVAKPRAEAETNVRRGDAHAFLVIPKGYGATGGFFARDAVKPLVGMDPARKAESGYLEGMLMEAIYGGMAERFTDPKKALADARKSREDLTKLGDSEQKRLLSGFLADMEKYFEKADFQTLAGGESVMMKPQLERIDVTQDATGKPRSAFELTFPSAILWGLYGCVMAFAISIVTEKTQGTLLRLRTTPLTWLHILAGKGLGCFIACLLVSVFLILIAWIGFGVRVLQPGWLLVAIPLTAFAFTGLMMFVATLGSTERAVAGAASGIFMPLAMLGGGMIPLYVMPTWLQNAASVSPFKWGILSLEGASWRGYEPMDYLLPFGVLILLGTAGFVLGVMLLTRRASL